jgi:hypothetical protein
MLDSLVVLSSTTEGINSMHVTTDVLQDVMATMVATSLVTNGIISSCMETLDILPLELSLQ